MKRQPVKKPIKKGARKSPPKDIGKRENFKNAIELAHDIAKKNKKAKKAKEKEARDRLTLDIGMMQVNSIFGGLF